MAIKLVLLVHVINRFIVYRAYSLVTYTSMAKENFNSLLWIFSRKSQKYIKLLMCHGYVCKFTFVNVKQELRILVEEVAAWCTTSHTVWYCHFFHHFELFAYPIHFKRM